MGREPEVVYQAKLARKGGDLAVRTSRPLAKAHRNKAVQGRVAGRLPVRRRRGVPAPPAVTDGFRLSLRKHSDKDGTAVKVLLRNPRRELDVRGPLSVVALLGRLELHRDTVIVIRNGTLVPGDATLGDSDEVEVRPVISGGAT